MRGGGYDGAMAAGDRFNRGLDAALHRAAAWLVVGFLVALAAVLPQLDRHWIPTEVVWGAGMLAVGIWVLLALELLWRVVWFERGRRSWPRLAYQGGCLLIPPLRLGLASPRSRTGHVVWLPGLGWRGSGRTLVRRLQRQLSLPMIVIGLMVLPALALEFIYKDELAERPAIALSLDIGLRLIWLAFAMELVIMLAASRSRFAYARNHWVDVAIVVVPLISFLRVLRVLRLGSMVRASRLATMARTYRLRGLAMRLMRAVLLLRVLERMSHRATRARIRMLEGSIEKHHRQIEEAEEEIAELQQHLEQREKAESAEVGSAGT